MGSKLKNLYTNFKKYNVLLGLAALFVIVSGFANITSFHVEYESVHANATVDPGEEIDVPVLMYHGILKDSKRWGQYVISPEEFENDLIYLKEKGYTTIVVQDLIDYVETGAPLPEKPVMLTFDDGYYNNYLYAYPLLQKYECKAVISVIGYYSEVFSNTEDVSAYYSHLTWKEIREMSESGLVEIQNHSYNMHKNASRKGAKKVSGESLGNYTKALNDDLMKLQTLLKENADITPTAFTYPFGAVSDASKEIIKQMGFKASLSSEQKVNKITRDPECLYLLHRIVRPSGIDRAKFFEQKLNIK